MQIQVIRIFLHYLRHGGAHTWKQMQFIIKLFHELQRGFQYVIIET